MDCVDELSTACVAFFKLNIPETTRRAEKKPSAIDAAMPSPIPPGRASPTPVQPSQPAMSQASSFRHMAALLFFLFDADKIHHRQICGMTSCCYLGLKHVYPIPNPEWCDSNTNPGAQIQYNPVAQDANASAHRATHAILRACHLVDRRLARGGVVPPPILPKLIASSWKGRCGRALFGGSCQQAANARCKNGTYPCS